MKNLGRTAPLALCAALAACSNPGAIPPQTNAAAAIARVPAASSQGSVVATVPLWRQLGAKDAGPASARTLLALAITLQYRDRAGLDALVAEQANPGSSMYHRWLSNAEFARRYAPSEEEYDRLLTSLRSAGFSVDATYRNRTVVDASAPAAVIERYFKTSIHRVVQAHGGAAYVNVRPAFSPPGLTGSILSVDGLNTIVVAQTYHHTLARRSSPQGLSISNASLFGPISSVTNARGYSPLAFTAAYDLPAMHSTTTTLNGSGRASGIIIDADFAESDLQQFLGYFKIDRTGPATKRVLIHGGPPPGDGSNDSIEAALDAETLVGIAPGTALSVYEISKLDNVLITDAFNTVVSDNVVDSVNESFGGCELYVGPRTAQAWNAIAEQAAAKGITFHAATGDSGGNLCANAPASLPYVVAVGGTALTVGNGGAWASEGAWSGGGGGISSVFPEPSWQAGVSGTVNRGRNEPDVAFDADPSTGTAYYFTGTWNTQYNPLGGTSLSSPIYGAIVAQIDQVKGGRAGLDTAGLYGFFTANGYGTATAIYFHDITNGNDGAFNAVTGYDLATGIGSVDAWNVAEQF